MKYGLFFKNTSLHVQKQEIVNSDYLYGEITTIERIFSEGLANASKCIPVISTFLGAKKNAVKKAEVQYAKSLQVEKMLYYFDVKNIKFGYIDLFEKEIEEMIEENDQGSILFYIPVDFLTENELDSILVFLSQKPCNLMIPINAGFNVTQKNEKGLPKILKFFGFQRVNCIFSKKSEMIKSASLFQEKGIRDLTYFG